MSFHCGGIPKISLAMNLLTVLILISSLSFMGYGITYFTSSKMKNEFKRFGLEQAGALTATLEILGALGLLLGFKFHPVLLIAAGGLSILMLLGLAIRIKVKDSVWVSLPALFFMLLNAFIFFKSLPLIH
jgi:uncharacterized membrane protein YphA (DoxX/SURF4 family)